MTIKTTTNIFDIPFQSTRVMITYRTVWFLRRFAPLSEIACKASFNPPTLDEAFNPWYVLCGAIHAILNSLHQHNKNWHIKMENNIINLCIVIFFFRRYSKVILSQL